MVMLINPGSGRLQSSTAWDNTEEQALKYVMDWFVRPMKDEGFIDLELINLHKQDDDGRWRFQVRHKITGKTVDIECHGINDLEAYQAENIFMPRVYWNGGSSSNPSIEDFAAKGFRPVITYVPTNSNNKEK